VHIEWATTVAEVGKDEHDRLAFVGLGGDTSPAESFPAAAALWVVVGLAARWDELGATVPETGNPVPHRVTWSVRGADTTEIAAGEGNPFGLLEQSAWHRPGWEGHHVDLVPLEFEVSEPGPCEIALRVDDSPEWTIAYYFALVDDLL
jgi:hypothetical protein